ncbi:PQQ-like beta-propeller repeat protein [Clostridium thermarum]|uniref:PQQ-like beta-propeller repeat protein n=1 Tax=Clostridium thermarum TaxID=1716543 RepID=UPI0013D3254A|nr:PQQ-like beta-propeller repeat protein [Clostridium thermarum]
MRRFLQKQLLELISSIFEGISYVLTKKNKPVSAISILQDCYDAICSIDTTLEIELSQNRFLIYKEICDSLKEMLESFAVSIEKHESLSNISKNIRKQLTILRNELKKEEEVRIEIVFMPYKASMWDSLESIWRAAKEDPRCDCYVVPIPYYDKGPDQSFSKYHYEGGDFPADVPVTNYKSYDLSVRKPDIVYIHNPYDGENFVTSVDPNYYSYELKKHTDKLVYVPYYSTSGGMSEGQRFCSAYYHVDYIILQAEKYRGFFDSALLKEKLIPLGSPKFDRIIRVCNNPPEPPADWKAKMDGKKVYFYNTSISGMLGNTEMFLKKMKYVFETFAAHENVCLLWRPHPLLESTLDSMRPQYKPIYDKLKRFFIDNNIGIYDETPDVTKSIALSDAYIGDSGTSIISLFGIAGKPIFVLNNNISTKPSDDDWRGEIIRGFNMYSDDRWLVTRGNKLYYSPNNNYKYQYWCDLSEYAYGDYYSYVLSFGNNAYICPKNSQDIIVLNENKITKRISLKKYVERPGSFAGAVKCGKFIFLIPFFYPAIVRYNTENGEIRYLSTNLDVFIGIRNGERVIGGYCVHKGYLFIASPVDNRVLAIEAKSGREQVLTTGANNTCGCLSLSADGRNLWFLPFSGTVITCWNPESGEVREYSDFPESLKCRYNNFGFECMERPFNRPAFYGDYVYLAPYWSNMYIRLNRVTGESIEWRPPFDIPEDIKNGYYSSWCKSWFIKPTDEEKKCYNVFSVYDRKLYNINLENNIFEEINIEFDVEELKVNEPGFKKNSEWLQYCCEESAFNSLSDFLEENITGNLFNRKNQIRAYGEIAANNDGTCGEKVHEFIKEHLDEN